MVEPLEAARRRLIEALGRQSAFWGLGKVPGELYAVLYLADGALSLGELARALGLSKGAVSVAVRQLERLGLVRRVLQPGDRRAYFEAERDFWMAARRILERRHKPEFDESFRLVAESLRLARSAPPGAERDRILERLSALQAFYDELDAAVATVLRLGPERLAQLVRLGARLLGRPGGDHGGGMR